MSRSIFFILFFTLFLVVCSIPLHSPKDASSYFRWMRGNPCPFSDAIPTAVKNSLQSVLVGQDAAIRDIVGRLRRWDSDYKRGLFYPLVLTLIGPSGVGKSTAAMAIARAISTSSVQDNSGNSVPEARLFFDGGQWSEDVVGSGGGGGGADGNTNATTLWSESIRQRVLDKIAQGLYQCLGQTVIVLDEAQKASRAALTAFDFLLKGRAVLSYRETASDARDRELDGRRSIIILTADIAEDELKNQLLLAAAETAFEAKTKRDSAKAASFEKKKSTGGMSLDDGSSKKSSSFSSTSSFDENDEEDYAMASLRDLDGRLREALMARSSDFGIDLGASHAVIPFFPFNQARMNLFLKRELRELAHVKPSSWDDLEFETTAFVQDGASAAFTKAGSTEASAAALKQHLLLPEQDGLEALAAALSDAYYVKYVDDPRKFEEFLRDLEATRSKPKSDGGKSDGGNKPSPAEFELSATASSPPASSATSIDGDDVTAVAPDSNSEQQLRKEPLDDGSSGDNNNNSSSSTAGRPHRPSKTPAFGICSRSVRSSAFVRYGCRSLKANYHGSPIDRLLTRIEDALDATGMTSKDEENDTKRLKKWTTYQKDDDALFQQRAFQETFPPSAPSGTENDVKEGTGPAATEQGEAAQSSRAAAPSPPSSSSDTPPPAVASREAGILARVWAFGGRLWPKGSTDTRRVTIRLRIECPPAQDQAKLLARYSKKTDAWPTVLTIKRCVSAGADAPPTASTWTVDAEGGQIGAENPCLVIWRGLL